MRILFISNDLIAGNIAHLLTKDGHDVKLYINEIDRRDNLNGLVKKIPDWRLELGWVGKNGLIVFDDVGFGDIQDSLRKDGYTVFGGNQKGDLLEQNRVLAQDIFKKLGLETLPIYNFKNISKAISFVKNNPTAWVVKQNGSSSKSLNYVGCISDGKDVIDVLKTYKRNRNHGSEVITLQKKAVGIEIAATRYFNGSKWIGPTLINIEHKKFFPGDLGPTTSEMGTLGWYDNDNNNRLFKDTLFKMEPYLKEINYRGIFDINCIVNENGTFPLEATSRFGSPIVHLQTILNTTKWAEILYSIAKGEECDLRYKDGFGVVVVLATPPFPYSKKINSISQIGTRIYLNESTTEGDMGNIHFEEVSYNTKNKTYYISDDRGYILYVTGYGKNAKESIDNSYNLIEKIHIPKVFYRNDIGSKFVSENEERLRKWGYIK